MTFEKHPLELVIDVLHRIVLVGDDFVQDHAPFGFDLVVRESGFGRELEQEPGRFSEVLLQDGGVQDDFLLGRVGVELPAQAVQVTADDRGTFALRAPEDRVFGEMGDTTPETGFVPGSAADAQGAPAYGGCASPDGVAQSGRCRAAPHYRFLDMRRRSSVRKPAGARPDILCLRM